MEPTKSNKTPVVIAVIIVVVLGLVAYMLVSKVGTEQAMKTQSETEQAAQIQNTQTAPAENLSAELDAATNTNNSAELTAIDQEFK